MRHQLRQEVAVCASTLIFRPVLIDSLSQGFSWRSVRLTDRQWTKKKPRNSAARSPPSEPPCTLPVRRYSSHACAVQPLISAVCRANPAHSPVQLRRCVSHSVSQTESLFQPQFLAEVFQEYSGKPLDLACALAAARAARAPPQSPVPPPVQPYVAPDAGSNTARGDAACDSAAPASTTPAPARAPALPKLNALAREFEFEAPARAAPAAAVAAAVSRIRSGDAAAAPDGDESARTDVWGGNGDDSGYCEGDGEEWEACDEGPWWQDNDLAQDPSLAWAASGDNDAPGSDTAAGSSAFVPGGLWVPGRHYGYEAQRREEVRQNAATLAETFTGMDLNSLERALEAHGGDVDAAADAIASGEWQSEWEAGARLAAATAGGAGAEGFAEDTWWDQYHYDRAKGFGGGDTQEPAASQPPPPPPAINDEVSFPSLFGPPGSAGGGGGGGAGGGGGGGWGEQPRRGGDRGAGGFATVLQSPGEGAAACGNTSACRNPQPGATIASAPSASFSVSFSACHCENYLFISPLLFASLSPPLCHRRPSQRGCRPPPERHRLRRPRLAALRLRSRGAAPARRS